MASKLDAATWAKVIEKAWRDEAFKAELLTAPRDALAKVGVALPENMQVSIMENTEDRCFFTLPPAPKDTAMSDADLTKLSNNAALNFTDCTKWIPVC